MLLPIRWWVYSTCMCAWQVGALKAAGRAAAGRAAAGRAAGPLAWAVSGRGRSSMVQPMRRWQQPMQHKTAARSRIDVAGRD
jgi:hypothetical protein